MTDNDELIKLFIQLASIDGVSGAEGEVTQFIFSYLSNLGFNPYIDNFGNLICKINNGGDYVLLSHMDTVKSTKDLKAIITNGKITSDGKTILGADNRAGIATILYALKKVITNKDELNNFTLAFTTCEETTLNGSRNISLDKNIRMGFVFDSSHRPGNFIYASPGLKSFNIKVNGKAAHSGINPEKGINSILVTSKAISNLKLGRIDNETTLNIGLIKGGSALNVVPELTIVEGEVRSFNINKIENILENILQVFGESAKQLNAKIEFSSAWGFKPFKISEDSEVYKKILKILKNLNLQANPEVSFGGSDANSLNAKGINAINIGIGAQNPHSNDEFILIEDLYTTADVAYSLMKKD